MSSTTVSLATFAWALARLRQSVPGQQGCDGKARLELSRTEQIKITHRWPGKFETVGNTMGNLYTLSVWIWEGKRLNSWRFDLLWRSKNSDVEQIQRGSSCPWKYQSEVISSHGILDSISSNVKLCYQNLELAIHISIVLHVFNGSQLTSFRVVRQT